MSYESPRYDQLVDQIRDLIERVVLDYQARLKVEG